MGDAKHTPGPWMAFAHPSYGFCIYPTKDGAQPVRDSFAVVNFADTSRRYGSEEAKANARLIASAPELLEALIAVKEVLDFAIGADLVPPNADGPAVMAANAIAKATGEQA